MPIQIQVPASTFREAVAGLVARPEEKTTLLARIPEDKSAVQIYLSEEDKPVLEELLKQLLTKNKSNIIRYCDHVETQGKAFFAA